MKGLIFKGSSLTCQREHLNTIIYNKNVVSQAQNFKKPTKTTQKTNKTQKKPPGPVFYYYKNQDFPTLILTWFQFRFQLLTFLHKVPVPLPVPLPAPYSIGHKKSDSPTERIITLRITSERITSERINLNV
jgi:hypothetical protein